MTEDIKDLNDIIEFWETVEREWHSYDEETKKHLTRVALRATAILDQTSAIIRDIKEN
ncbi:MAG: hypothetical protein WCS03_18940 [Bacteroidota bacterium]